MPHGRLTPLGKQLRYVLAGLRSRRYTTVPGTRRAPAITTPTELPTRPSAYRDGTRESLVTRELHGGPIAAGAAQAAAIRSDAEGLEDRSAEAEQSTTVEDVDKDATTAITEVLRRVGKGSLAPKRRLRFKSGIWISPDAYERLGLESAQSILTVIARYIEYQETLAEYAMIVPVAFELTSAEATALELHKVDRDDIRSFAAIIAEENSVEAARLIKERIKTHGPGNFPASIMITLLRRQYLSASALTILIEQCILLKESVQSHESPFADSGLWFIIFTLLLEHCRAMRPLSLPDVCDLWLDSLEQSERVDPVAAVEDIVRTTAKLNKALSQIALPTSLNPYKDIPLQEASFVKVLTFMAQHDPPIQTDRRGYNAITSVQLAKKKTLKEQTWAEIKAPSWPPWRHLRNAMDENVITVEEHGTSIASKTIQSMHMAGYASDAWDQVASIYAGWDLDGTPTIQTRKHGERLLRASDAVWTARVKTTRTVQEAWACYLAYEEQCQVPSQEVLLAVTEKLQYEFRRLNFVSNRQHQSGDLPKIYPGDVPETHPLPSSTHQHTYTRTPAPTMDAFYDAIRARGIVPKSHLLAFLLENTLERSRGIRYLIDGSKENQALVCLWKWDPRVDLSQIDETVFAAAIRFHSRLTRNWITLPAQSDGVYAEMQDMTLVTRDQTRRLLRARYPITYALSLLIKRKSLNLRPWADILIGLGQHAILSIHRAFRDRSYEILDRLPPGLKWCYGTTLAYEVARQVLSKMRKLHFEHDAKTLHAFCVCTENAVVGSWKLMRDHSASPDYEPFDRRSALANDLATSAETLLANFDITPKLRVLFRVFVGADEKVLSSRRGSFAQHPSQPNLPSPLMSPTQLQQQLQHHQQDPKQAANSPPSILLIPSPYLLHAYIRALGWSADYEGLIELVRWMAQHAATLSEHLQRDRNGLAAMRRAIIALRVFTERRWYRPLDPSPSHGRTSRDASAQLDVLETAAPEAVVEEMRGLVGLREDWGGWARDEEVEVYCDDPRFRWFLDVSADGPLPRDFM